jgi:hypothetical protein
MNGGALLVIRNNHTAACSEPPTITNDAEGKYFGNFESRAGEQWVFVSDQRVLVTLPDIRGKGVHIIPETREGVPAQTTVGADEARATAPIYIIARVKKRLVASRR